MISKLNISDFYNGLKLYNCDINPKYFIEYFLNEFKNKKYSIKIYGDKNFHNYYNSILMQFIFDDNNKINKCINFTISCKKKIPVYKIYQSLYIPNLKIEFTNNNCKYIINKINNDFNVNINDFMQFDNISLFNNEMYDLNLLKLKISDCIYKSNINISNNDFETIKLSPKIFLKIYTKINTNKKYFFTSDLYQILTEELYKNKKDLSNRFEKMLLLNEIL